MRGLTASDPGARGKRGGDRALGVLDLFRVGNTFLDRYGIHQGGGGP